MEGGFLFPQDYYEGYRIQYSLNHLLSTHGILLLQATHFLLDFVGMIAATPHVYPQSTRTVYVQSALYPRREDSILDPNNY